MLANQAKAMVEEIKEMKDLCTEAIVKDIDFTDVDYKTFKALASCMTLLDMSCDYMIEQAEMMDEMDRKLDKLLAISERKGSL